MQARNPNIWFRVRLQQPEEKPQKGDMALPLSRLSAAFVHFNIFVISCLKSWAEMSENKACGQSIKAYFEHNEAHWGEQWQPYNDAAAFDVFCKLVVSSWSWWKKYVTLSWEQSNQGPVKLYNNVLKIVSFDCRVAHWRAFSASSEVVST